MKMNGRPDSRHQTPPFKCLGHKGAAVRQVVEWQILSDTHEVLDGDPVSAGRRKIRKSSKISQILLNRPKN